MKSHAVKKRTKILLIVLLSLVVLAVAAVLIARGVARSFIQSEISTRSDWEIDTGDVADREASQQVTVYTDPVEASIQITQIVPDEYEDEGFTYYDENVQDRLAYTLAGAHPRGGPIPWGPPWRCSIPSALVPMGCTCISAPMLPRR